MSTMSTTLTWKYDIGDLVDIGANTPSRPGYDDHKCNPFIITELQVKWAYQTEEFQPAYRITSKRGGDDLSYYEEGLVRHEEPKPKKVKYPQSPYRVSSVPGEAHPTPIHVVIVERGL